MTNLMKYTLLINQKKGKFINNPKIINDFKQTINHNNNNSKKKECKEIIILQ